MPSAQPPTTRVVMILRHFTVGGLERVLLSHVRILLAAGYQVTVCVLDPGRDNALVAELPPQAQLVIVPPGRLRRVAFLSRIVSGATVLLQFGDGRLYPSIRPALRTARTVVRFCHSDYSHLRTPTKNRLDRFLARSEDTIVAVGGRSTRFLLDDVGVPASKVITLTNATEPRAAVPAPPWSWARDPYLVSVQSLYPHKGHDSLLAAFARVLARIDQPVRLVVIGDGDQTIALRLLADRLGITDQVVWLGAVWQKDLVDSVLAGASAFVSASRFEGVPISILEARQHGLPLVLTDIPGHRDGAGTSPATFIPVDNTEAFADQVLNVLARTRPSDLHQPDTHQLTREWETYRDGLLAIVAGACGSAAATAPRTVDA
ncbi:glycosyltransferase [Kitasatospora sp. MAP5-34]|uniref:glycosyltransferase n=1 Tax=Kitasatospora sp. MAP5-34 TaxID=3035102 RepID=UPI002475EA19|nr:glycosyltransferase [Kitasatospora sp. MAP5-34]MDH6578650.1 glycosyltransferase involved in cell wall biosynthesis [Kitasatospora sp. MAP5-34]